VNRFIGKVGRHFNSMYRNLMAAMPTARESANVMPLECRSLKTRQKMARRPGPSALGAQTFVCFQAQNGIPAGFFCSHWADLFRSLAIDLSGAAANSSTLLNPR
jgi:hypothetical protein